MSSAPPRAMEADREATVETPLLPQTSRFDDEESTHPHRHLTHVVVIILVSIFLLELGDYMMRAPSMRVLEDIICQKFYESTTPVDSPITRPIPEHKCKVPSVQVKVAMVKGWNEAFSCMPAIFLAIPYGYVGDRFGRKIPLLLAVFGILLSQLWVQFVCKFFSTP